MNRYASPFGDPDNASPSLNVLVPTSGRSVALLVGSAGSQNRKDNSLEAASLGKVLSSRFGFDTVRYITTDSILPKDRATSENVVTALDELVSQCTAQDTFVLYVSCVGFTQMGRLYLETDDTKTVDAVHISHYKARCSINERSSLPVDSLLLSLTKIKARQVMVFVRASRSVDSNDEKVFNSDSRLFQKCASEIARHTGGRVGLIFSCKQGQHNYKFNEDRLGFFTKFLIEALDGDAKSSTFDDVTAYTYDRVRQAAGKRNPQVPEIIKSGRGSLSFARDVSEFVPITSKSARSNRLAAYPNLKAYIASLRTIPSREWWWTSEDNRTFMTTRSAFRMGATPVTVALWEEYCAATHTPLPTAPDWGLLPEHPVVNVSWIDILGSDGKGGFCAWASDVAGIQLTLPTSEQFGYAAGGGLRGKRYPWGYSYDDSKLWCSGLTPRTGTAPVVRSSNTFRNVFGLTDMSGNIWQWCSDIYVNIPLRRRGYPISHSSKNIPSRRYVAGGGWNLELSNDGLKCTVRFMDDDVLRANNLGFRLAAGPG